MDLRNLAEASPQMFPKFKCVRLLEKRITEIRLDINLKMKHHNVDSCDLRLGPTTTTTKSGNLVT